MTQPQSTQSDLAKICSMTVPQNYSQVVYKLFDKKLRSFLSLQSKQQVLQKCQDLLIAKTVQYMNDINKNQQIQLSKLNSLNQILSNKQSLIKDMRLHIVKQQIQIKDQKIMISSFIKQISELKKSMSDQKTKYLSQISECYQTIRQNQKIINHIKSEHSVVKSSLEAINKQLNMQLAMKTTQLKNSMAEHKNQVTNLKGQKEKMSMEFNRKYREKVTTDEQIKDDLKKDKKYLQDLIEIKEDEIKEAKKPKVKKFVQQAQFSFCIKIQRQKPIKQKLIKQKTIKQVLAPIRSRSKTKHTTKQNKKQQIQKEKEMENQNQNEKVKEKQSNFNTLSAEQTQPIIIFVQQQNIIKPMTKIDFGIQCDQQFRPYLQQNIQVKIQKQKKLIDSFVQTIVQDPTEQKELNQFQKQLKQFMDNKYKMIYDQKAKDLQTKMKQEYLETMKEANKNVNYLKTITYEKIELYNTKLRQIENIYDQRPSRQEDLEYIRRLLLQSASLTKLCQEANRNTDNAYVAMQQYHSQLQSYKNSVPVNISGQLPPKIHSQKTIKDIRSLRNARIHTISSPNNFEKKRKIQDLNLNSFTKQLLNTQYDTQYVMSPMIRTKKSRPGTTTGLSKPRRKSLA